ncbi:MAG: four helix bundle protein [Gemmatimonadaceae bacterium]
MRDYRTLDTWKKADALVMDIYRALEGRRCSFTGLRSQLLRAADGLATNIVEGCGKNTEPEFLRFLEMAHASGKELGYQLTKAARVGLITTSEFDNFGGRCDEIRRMLYGLMRTVRDRIEQAEARRMQGAGRRGRLPPVS